MKSFNASFDSSVMAMNSTRNPTGSLDFFRPFLLFNQADFPLGLDQRTALTGREKTTSRTVPSPLVISGDENTVGAYIEDLRRQRNAESPEFDNCPAGDSGVRRSMTGRYLRAVSRNRIRSSGLVRKSSHPALKQTFRSSPFPSEVIMTTGNDLNSASALIRAQHSAHPCWAYEDP